MSAVCGRWRVPPIDAAVKAVIVKRLSHRIAEGDVSSGAFKTHSHSLQREPRPVSALHTS